MRITPAGEALRPAFDTISRRFVRILYAGVDCKEAEKLECLLGKTLSGENMRSADERSCGLETVEANKHF